ncbi:MAG: hypothetical protein H0U12_10090 [Thermoleophilaceae bacterium]|nr:hypothetical protein [Thermoleophilaceae bacterium]
MRRRGEGDAHQAGGDRGDCGDLPQADVLAEHVRAHDEQEHEADGQRRLDEGERRDQQRDGMKPPAERDEPRTQEPARAPGERGQQRRPQRMTRRCLAGFERLNRDACVVEDCGKDRRDHAEEERHR